MQDFREKLKDLPTTSGVYIMLDEYEQILYVGKAKNLKNRVRQYFQNSTTKTEKTILLVQKIADFRYIITKSEVEALVLENNLIKEHKPYYNILLKDDKAYPYIKINLKEIFPKIEVVRRLKADGSKYFGPYMIGMSTKVILDLLHSVYPVRSCISDLSKQKRGRKECLNYHLGHCLAPCVNKVSPEEYNNVIKKVIDFLNGNDNEVKALLKHKLEEASFRQEYELAINYRDSLTLMEKIVRKQIANLPREFNLDIFAYATSGLYGTVNYTVVRGGKILGSENHPINDAGKGEEILSSYIMQFYDNNPILAEEILTNETIEFGAELSDYISRKKGKRVTLMCPKGGARAQLVDLAFNNASDNLEKTVAKIASHESLTIGAVDALRNALKLASPPKRIECYDISNISGVDKVASMVVFINGEKASEMYRRFRIKTVSGIDDFACMREVLTRRMSELSGTDISFSDQPNLIVVDGGKGQLSYANEVLEGSGIELISLAEKEEYVFRPHQSEPIILKKNSFELMLLQRIRDEAHRFAVTYHRALRKDRQTRSNLQNIPGIGEKRARALLVHFKKIEKIAKASIEEIMAVESFGKAQAEIVYNFYRGKKDDEI